MTISNSEGVFDGVSDVTRTGLPGSEADGGDGGTGIKGEGFSATKVMVLVRGKFSTGRSLVTAQGEPHAVKSVIFLTVLLNALGYKTGTGIARFTLTLAFRRARLYKEKMTDCRCDIVKSILGWVERHN